MKKLLTLLLIGLMFVVLFAKEEKKELSPFMKYYKNQNDENFINAYNYYKKIQDDKENGNDAKIKLLYLYSIESDKLIEELQKNEDNLAVREKFQFANILLEKGEFDKAVAIYERLNKAVPKWSCPYRHKGEAFYKMNKLQKAEEALKKAIETRKEHYDAYVMLAEVQRDLKKYDQALKTLETGLSYKGKDIEDPEKEVDNTDVLFLHLELLKKNNKDYNQILKKLKKIAPNDERLKSYD